jgi:hypothetical protein
MPERRAPLWLGLWPGLPQLWLRGSWAGLAAASGFAVLVDFVLATTLVWTEIWVPFQGVLWWCGVATVWAMSAAWWMASGRRHCEPVVTAPAGDLFPLALTEYLRGNFFEAERQVSAMLRAAPQDVEARLLRASILRRTGKRDEARRLLDVLGRSEAATKWQFEIERERERLEPKHDQPEVEAAAVSRDAA